MLLVIYISFFMIDFVSMYDDTLCPSFVRVVNGTVLPCAGFTSVHSYLWGSIEKAPHLPLYTPIPWIGSTDSVEKHPFIRYAICDCMDSIVQKRQVCKSKSCRIAAIGRNIDTIDAVNTREIKTGRNFK